MIRIVEEHYSYPLALQIQRANLWLIALNVLYYEEPRYLRGGVSNVAYYLPKSLSKKVNLTYFPYFMPKESYMLNILNIYAKFVKKEFGIIHFNLVPSWINGGYMLLRFAKIREAHTVLNVHGIIQLEHKAEPAMGSIPPKVLSNALSSCKFVDRIVVNSEYMRNNVVTWYGINRHKIVVIPNGVDMRKFHERDDQLALDGDPAILYLGRLSRIKGVDVLIQAIAKLRSELPNIKLHLVGSGYMSDFQLIVKEKKMEKFVVFHGWAPDSMVPHYYKSADVLVFPSRYEPFGIVILEAMASGAPIIASNAGGIPEILSNGENGILFKSSDADALSKAILALHQDNNLKKKIIQGALKTVAKYSWDNVAERYVSLYENLCQRNRYVGNRS